MAENSIVDKGCPVCHSDVEYEDGTILGHYFACSSCGALTIIPAYYTRETAVRMITGQPKSSEAGSYKHARGIFCDTE